MNPKPSSCEKCPGQAWVGGFVPADGRGDKGVLMVLEAPGEDGAGQYLWSQLARVGLKRDDFRIHNVLSCQPPANKLAGMPYELPVIQHCAPNLDATIAAAREQADAQGQSFTILTLGKIAFKRVMGWDDRTPELKKDYYGYPFWSDTYQAWVVAAMHPSYLMKGNHREVPILQYCATRAIDIARDGIEIRQPMYALDPEPHEFERWIDRYLRALVQSPDDVFLSYDIETPFKQGIDEELVAKEQDPDQTILRVSFSYAPGCAISVPWQAPWVPGIMRLFAAGGPKVGWNNANYDDPRVKRYLDEWGAPWHGDSIDAMLAWHVLHTSLPKGLGFVTPFYVKNATIWKHLDAVDPAFYNAKDADMALQNWLGIREDLKRYNLWHVFDRHVVQLNRVFSYMHDQGVLLDGAMRAEAETKLSALLKDVEEKIEATVPLEARRLKIYKKAPKSLDGLVKVSVVDRVKKCSSCGLLAPLKAHFKPVSKTRAAKGEVNPCAATAYVMDSMESVERWAKPLPWKVSKVGLEAYQRVKKHRPIIDRKANRVIFDESAIMRLMKMYPGDALYPLILENREYSKLLSTYIGVTDAQSGRVVGGLPVGRDGRIHPSLTHNPSTLRSACQNPNLQNLPRHNPRNPDDLANYIRRMIVASPGHVLDTTDYAGIEAVLVGYEAGDPDYIRLAKIDVHTFYTMYGLYELEKGERIKASDLPDLSWSDDKLIPHLAHWKILLSKERNSLFKHLVHGANFKQGAKGAAEKIYSETGIEYPVALVQKVMDVYFSLFPKIPRWHNQVLHRAGEEGYLRNAFGYVHRFSRVWEWEQQGGEWVKSPGPEMNKVIAFLPQSTAAGIIKEAMMRLFFDRYEEAGQYLRLLIHDELFFEVPEEKADAARAVIVEEMGKPVPELKLPESYGMGPALSILTESKRGYRWGDMK